MKLIKTCKFHILIKNKHFNIFFRISNKHMPLYELILLSRCGEAKGTANLFRQIALNIFEKGGILYLNKPSLL